MALKTELHLKLQKQLFLNIPGLFWSFLLALNTAAVENGWLTVKTVGSRVLESQGMIPFNGRGAGTVVSMSPKGQRKESV